jgi:hypothetical protein
MTPTEQIERLNGLIHNNNVVIERNQALIDAGFPSNIPSKERESAQRTIENLKLENQTYHSLITVEMLKIKR